MEYWLETEHLREKASQILIADGSILLTRSPRGYWSSFCRVKTQEKQVAGDRLHTILVVASIYHTDPLQKGPATAKGG